MAPPDEDVSAGSILRELILNQYQAIVLGGAALASLITLNPLPLLVWLGSETGAAADPRLGTAAPPRRPPQAGERARAGQRRARTAGRGRSRRRSAKRYAAMEELCRLIEANYQSLTGISQVYLSEQRGKLDVILQGYLHRLMARAALRADAGEPEQPRHRGGDRGARAGAGRTRSARARGGRARGRTSSSSAGCSRRCRKWTAR